MMKCFTLTTKYLVMHEFKTQFSKWDNEELVIARVIKTWGSSPRPVGSSLIVDQEMNMTGSVSGGCVEGAVLKEAKVLFKTGGAKILDYGVTDEEAWSVGLSCGGRISVFLQVLSASELRKQLFDNIGKNQSCVWITKIESSVKIEEALISSDGSKQGMSFGEEIINISLSALDKRTHEIIETQEGRYFAHIIPRKAQMLIIGAAHITADLIHLAKFYGFETIVIDPRAAFADRTSFQDPPDEIIKSYPSEVLGNYILDQYCYAVILSHDPKIDDNALQILLKNDLAYIGALGSKKTHAKRVLRLSEAGFSEEQISKIAAPVGLKINAKSPREIALSIMAQIIETKNKFL